MSKDVATAAPLRFRSIANDSTGQFQNGEAIASNPPPIKVSSEYDSLVNGDTSRSANNTVFQLKAELKPTALKKSFEDTNQRSVLQQFRQAKNKISDFNYLKNSNQPEKFNFDTIPNEIQLSEYESGHKDLKETDLSLLKNQAEPGIGTSSDVPVLQGFGFIKRAASAVGSGARNVGSGIVNTGRAIHRGATALGQGIVNTGRAAWDTIQSLPGQVLEGLIETAKNTGLEAVGGVNNFLGNTAGIFDRLFGPQGEEVNADEIPTRHVMDEFNAHRIAYKDANGLMDGSALSVEEIKILKNGGYDPYNMAVRTGSNGFQAVLIMPRQEGLLPMLAFRGTADLGGVLTDIDPKQVGDFQFINNSGKIEELIKSAGGRVDVCGHSLGGAMAQLTAAHYTSQVARVTTFQSPGISSEATDLFRQNLENIKEEDRPAIAHHIVRNDMVSKAGEENLPGSIFEHDLGDINPIEAHTTFVFATRNFEEARSKYGITDEFMEQEVGKNIKENSAVTRFEQQPYEYQRKVAEYVRSGIGNIREGGLAAGREAVDYMRNPGAWFMRHGQNLVSHARTRVTNTGNKLQEIYNMAKQRGSESLFRLMKAIEYLKK